MNVLRITKAVNIALQAMVLIAKSPTYLNVSIIADKLNMSRHHSAKVMQRLTKSGFIKSMRGPTGGFKMIRKPEDINLLEIFESIEGHISSDNELEWIVSNVLKETFDRLQNEVNSEFAMLLEGLTLEQML